MLYLCTAQEFNFYQFLLKKKNNYNFLFNSVHLHINTKSAKQTPCITRHGSLMHVYCTAVFLLTTTFFVPQMKSASFIKSDKLPVANCWPVIFTWQAILHDFLLSVKMYCRAAWFLPKVLNYTFNNADPSQIPHVDSLSLKPGARCTFSPPAQNHKHKRANMEEESFLNYLHVIRSVYWNTTRYEHRICLCLSEQVWIILAGGPILFFFRYIVQFYPIINNYVTFSCCENELVILLSPILLRNFKLFLFYSFQD